MPPTGNGVCKSLAVSVYDNANGMLGVAECIAYRALERGVYGGYPLVPKVFFFLCVYLQFSLTKNGDFPLTTNDTDADAAISAKEAL